LLIQLRFVNSLSVYYFVNCVGWPNVWFSVRMSLFHFGFGYNIFLFSHVAIYQVRILILKMWLTCRTKRLRFCFKVRHFALVCQNSSKITTRWKLTQMRYNWSPCFLTNFFSYFNVFDLLMLFYKAWTVVGLRYNNCASFIIKWSLNFLTIKLIFFCFLWNVFIV